MIAVAIALAWSTSTPAARFNCSSIVCYLFGSADLTGAFLGAEKADTVASHPWTKEDVKALKAHSKARTPVVQIAKAMKRTEGALRRKAGILGIGLGHDR